MLSPSLSPTKSDLDFVVCTDAVSQTTGNVTSLGPTTIMLDSGPGITVYRAVQGVVVTTVAGAAGTIQGTLSWTDPAGAATTQTNAVNATTTGRNTQATSSAIMFCAANTSVQFQTTVTSADAALRYNTYVTLEKLH